MFPKPSEKIAIYIENKEISYNELIQNITSFTSYLKIKKGDRVLIFAENSPEWIYAFYSIWAKKGIAVPCDYNLKEQELEYIHHNLLLDLGLDSLGILSFQTYIEETFGIKISNADILNHPTVEEITGFIAQHKLKFEEQAQNWLQLIIKNTSYTFKHGFSLILFLKFLVKPLVSLYFKLKCNGKDNIPDGPAIFAPNHQSFLDSVLLIASLPNKTLMHSYFLSRELGFIKVSRGDSLAKLMNTIIVNIDTNLKDSIQKMAAILQNKHNIIIFPEGTRTIDGQLGTFKKTFAILSKELNYPVVPIAIQGAYQSFKRGKILPKPAQITIDILSPIYPNKLTVDDIVAKTQVAIAQKLEQENN